MVTQGKVNAAQGVRVGENNHVVTQRAGVLIGVFDLFHVGHLELLERARAECDRLTVGVLDDEWAERVWGARPFVPVTERAAIIGHLRCVDAYRILPEPAVDGAPIVFAASDTDGVLAADELAGVAAGRLRVLPPAAGSRSPILRAAIDRRPSQTSVVA